MQASRENLALMSGLRKRQEFLAVQSSGKKWISQGFILQIAPHNQSDPPKFGLRLGFTVSKKVHKSAVQRNRIKHRLRAVAADILPLYAKRGYDYVLVGRLTAADRPYETLKSDLMWCLKKMDLYQTPLQKPDEIKLPAPEI